MRIFTKFGYAFHYTISANEHKFATIVYIQLIIINVLYSLSWLYFVQIRNVPWRSQPTNYIPLCNFKNYHKYYLEFFCFHSQRAPNSKQI